MATALDDRPRPRRRAGEVHGAKRRPEGADEPPTPCRAWRSAFLAAPLPARHLRRLRRALRHLRDRDHLGPLRGLPRGGDGGGAGARSPRSAAPPPRAGRAAGQLPLHPRLPRRAGALLHRPRPRRPRRRGRAVGRDQGGGLGGGDRGRRHDHPPPRGRPRPSPLVRPPAPRRPSPRRCGRRRPSSTRRDPQPRRADQSPPPTAGAVRGVIATRTHTRRGEGFGGARRGWIARAALPCRDPNPHPRGDPRRRVPQWKRSPQNTRLCPSRGGEEPSDRRVRPAARPAPLVPARRAQGDAAARVGQERPRLRRRPLLGPARRGRRRRPGLARLRRLLLHLERRLLHQRPDRRRARPQAPEEALPADRRRRDRGADRAGDRCGARVRRARDRLLRGRLGGRPDGRSATASPRSPTASASSRS